MNLIGLDRNAGFEPEAFALAQLILRGVTAGLEGYLQEQPRFRECAARTKACL